jgi:hypothetical protein
VAGCACGGTSVTTGMKRDAEEAGQKAMPPPLNELLPQTRLGARTRKAKSSKKPRSVEEEAVPLIRDQMGSPHLRQFNVCNTMQVRSWACRHAMPKRGSGSKGQHAGMAQRAHAAVWLF